MNTVILGCGAIADRWARVLTADPRVRIVGLVDPQVDRAERLAERRCPNAALATTLQRARAAVAVDVVVNLTPPETHAPVSREALHAGLHVLTEKPLAMRLADAVELAELAQASRRVLAVMHNRGRDPQFLAFADRVTAAGRGPYAVTADVVVNLHEPGFRSQQRLPVTTDLAVHAFDQIQALICAAPVEVSGTEVPLPFLDKHCGLATIAVTFADTSALSYRGGYAARGLATNAVGAWRVDGPDYAARWEPLPGRPDNQPPPYQQCIASMLDAVESVRAGGVPPWPTLALRSTAMLEAVLISADASRPAAVAPTPSDSP
ncbi:MAG TPA: Gfo/Idh/MocA family oxidoreductase [Pseudonocardiaceae bacterium]|nr:Gfo/Idh/MocA family oxidoreductase [Pseudonocardiaceae bacterium]